MATATERPPTARQMAVLTYIYETARDRGYQPSFREISSALDLGGTNGVTNHLAPMAHKGYIRRSEHRCRCIVMLLRPDRRPFDGFAEKPSSGPEEDRLTAKQADVLRFIYERARDHGYQPSVADMMGRFELSPNGVMCHLRGLARKEWIRLSDTCSRKITLLRRPDGSSFDGFADKEPTP